MMATWIQTYDKNTICTPFQASDPVALGQSPRNSIPRIYYYKNILSYLASIIVGFSYVQVGFSKQIKVSTWHVHGPTICFSLFRFIFMYVLYVCIFHILCMRKML